MGAAAAPHQKRAFASLLTAGFGVVTAGGRAAPSPVPPHQSARGEGTHIPELPLSSGEHGWAGRHLTP